MSVDGIALNSGKVEASKNYPKLIDVKGVKSFFGHVGFYESFVQDISRIATPLTKLTPQEIPIE